nr:hypothetical protein [Tanacetum cinerariifolium]
MSYDREHVDQDDDDLTNERDLIASLIEKLKCEIDDSKNRNKFLETSNKALVDKLKGEIKDFKNKIKSLESSNNHFKEANNELSKTNQLMYKDLKKFQAELDKYRDVKYASKVEIDYAKAKGDLMSYNVESEKKVKMSHTPINNENSKESFNKQATLLEKQMDETILWDQKCKSSKELFKIKKGVDTIFNGVDRCKQTIAKRTYFGHMDPFIQNTIEGNFCPQIRRINADLEKIHLCLKEETVADLRYFNSPELEVDSLKSQLETQKTQFLNEIDRLSREYYYADHTNAILDVYTELDEVTNLQIILFIVDFGCSKHMTGNLKLLTNFMEKFLGSVKFGNDQIAPILGYGDLGNDLLIDSRETYLYSITLQDTSYPNLICLMAKATSSQAWLWHRRLSHLNFDTINLLSKNDIMIGLPKLKFVKDHLCSSSNGCLFLLGISGVDDGRRGLMEMGEKMAEKAGESGQQGDGGKVRITLKMSKISQKTRQYQHRIRSLKQKPDQRAIFSRNQAKKPKMTKESKPKWSSICAGKCGGGDGSHVVIEVDEWNGRKSYTAFGREKKGTCKQ